MRDWGGIPRSVGEPDTAALLMRGERDLTQGNRHHTANLAVPFFLPIFSKRYGAVDLWVVGRYASSVADVSRDSLGSRDRYDHLDGCRGADDGGTVPDRKVFGAREYHRVTETVGTMLVTFLLCTVLLTGLMFWLSPTCSVFKDSRKRLR